MKVLLTGVSGGFGKLTAHELISRGHSVAGTMRSTQKYPELAEELRAAGVHLIEMDVVDDQSVEQGCAHAIEALGGLDVVINNAGVGVLGVQEMFTADDWRYLFDVNVFGVQRVCRATLPHLRSQGSGLVINVSSLLGRITMPFYGPYNASKWALEAMSENFRTELSTYGVEVCIVEPGGYPTSFMENLLRPSDHSLDQQYEQLLQVQAGMFGGFEQALHNNPEQRPEKVAQAIAGLLDMPRGQKPFRTIVDNMGMGAPLQGYNDALHQITHGMYSAFHLDGLLSVK